MNPHILVGKEYLTYACGLIENARKTIRIIIFDWRIYYTPHNRTENTLIATILKAKERGVDIKVLVNNDYVIEELKKYKIQSKRCRNFKIVHAKMLLIDETQIVVGSHNFTCNAFEKNLEISIAYEDKINGQLLTKLFNELWS